MDQVLYKSVPNSQGCGYNIVITYRNTLITVTPPGSPDCDTPIPWMRYSYKVWFLKPVGFVGSKIIVHTAHRPVMENHPQPRQLRYIERPADTTRLYTTI